VSSHDPLGDIDPREPLVPLARDLDTGPHGLSSREAAGG
jgi:hypothetical protein